MNHGKLLLCALFLPQKREVLPHAAIVDPKELVRTSGHVNVVWLALRALLVHESIYRIVCRGAFDQTIHDLKECLSQIRRALLGGRIAFPFVVSGFVLTGIHTRICRKRALLCKPGDISDLGHELRSQSGAYAIHPHDDRIFRKL